MSPEFAEREQDRRNTEATRAHDAYSAQALDELIERLFEGEKVGRCGLQDHLEGMADLHELVSAARISGDVQAMWTMIEKRLRVELQDSTELEDHAAELAAEISE